MNPARTRASGGCLPRCVSSSRIANASGRFTLSAMAVAHPVGVIPTIRTPSHRKCAGHGSRRGLNSAICSPVCASRTSRRAPLRKEQGTQANARFSNVVFPPLRSPARHGRHGKPPLGLSGRGRNTHSDSLPCRSLAAAGWRNDH